MEATRRVYQTVDFEGLFSRMADRAMGLKTRSTANYPQTAWELVKPLLKDWHSLASLRKITSRNVNEAVTAHRKLLDKRGKDARTEYRLKAKP